MSYDHPIYLSDHPLLQLVSKYIPEIWDYVLIIQIMVA